MKNITGLSCFGSGSLTHTLRARQSSLNVTPRPNNPPTIRSRFAVWFGYGGKEGGALYGHALDEQLATELRTRINPRHTKTKRGQSWTVQTRNT